jgi:hypothetical protein
LKARPIKLAKLATGQLIKGRQPGIYLGPTITITNELLMSPAKAMYKCFHCKCEHRCRFGRLKVYDGKQKNFVDFIAEI